MPTARLTDDDGKSLAASPVNVRFNATGGGSFELPIELAGTSGFVALSGPVVLDVVGGELHPITVQFGSITGRWVAFLSRGDPRPR